MQLYLSMPAETLQRRPRRALFRIFAPVYPKLDRMSLLALLTFISELKQYINPEFIINVAGDLALPVLILIIFAETGLMVGFFLPGDSLLFITGLYTAEGVIAPAGTPSASLALIMGCLIAAAIVGDQVGYVIGRTLGRSLFNRKESRFFKPKYLHQTKAFYDRHGGKTIIIGRFIPIVRTFAPVVAGAVELEYKRFVVYNIIGGIVWIASMLSLGYFVGVMFKPYVSYITIGIIVVSFIPVVQTLWQEWRNGRNKAQQP